VTGGKGRFGYLEFPDQSRQSVSPVPREDSDLAHFHAAEDLFLEGYWEPALREYSRSLRLNKGLIPAWVGQVLCLLEMEEVDEALTWANNALSWFPRSPDLIAAKALVLCRMGKGEEALACSDASFEGESPGYLKWLVRGEILVANGRKATARQCFDRVTAEQPDDWKLHLAIGRIFLRYQMPAQALAAFNRAAHLHPHSAFLWYQMALAYRMMRLTRSVRHCCRQALKLRPQFPEASDLEKSARTVPCFVATACLSENDGPVLARLRHLRETTLSRTTAGRIFLACYDTVGPACATACARSRVIRRIARTLVLAAARILPERNPHGDDRPHQGSD